jgi:hypothetical protein
MALTRRNRAPSSGLALQLPFCFEVSAEHRLGELRAGAGNLHRTLSGVSA